MRKDEAVLAVIQAQQATIERQMATIENMMGQVLEVVKQVFTPVAEEPVRPVDIYDQEAEVETPDRDPAELDWPDIEARLAGVNDEGWEDNADS